MRLLVSLIQYIVQVSEVPRVHLLISKAVQDELTGMTDALQSVIFEFGDPSVEIHRLLYPYEIGFGLEGSQSSGQQQITILPEPQQSPEHLRWLTVHLARSEPIQRVQAPGPSFVYTSERRLLHGLQMGANGRSIVHLTLDFSRHLEVHGFKGHAFEVITIVWHAKFSNLDFSVDAGSFPYDAINTDGVEIRIILQWPQRSTRDSHRFQWQKIRLALTFLKQL